MPDNRLIHRREGHSEKVSGLTDLEHRVWMTYIYASDDFGIIRATAVAFQAENDALAKRPAGKVQAAIKRLVAVGLLRTFNHQGQPYLYQHDWQTWQGIRFPRKTNHPAIPPEALAECCPETQRLFAEWFPGGKQNKPEDSRNPSEELPKNSGNSSASRARTPETANGLRLMANGSPSGEGSGGATRIDPSVHIGHAHCNLVCVPGFLHAEFRKALNRPNDPDGCDDELVKGYREHCASWPEGKPTGEALQFWRAWFRARYPAPTAKELRGQAESKRQDEFFSRLPS